MANLELRPYQSQAINEIRVHFKKVKRVLLWLATGGGKTHCFSFMMIEAKNRGKRCLMIVRGRKLVDQASKRLFKENVTHGVMMNGHWNLRPQAPIQICSIDTLMSRNWRPKADLIVIDEAHMAVSDGYKEFLADYPNAYVVAVTATPYTNKSMAHIADEIVHPITAQELIDDGFLIRARYFAPTEPNLTGVKTDSKTGDYVTKQLAKAMDKSSIVGDIITHWKRLAENRPTIVFAVSVEHSQHIAAQFCEAGIAAEHEDANTPEAVRNEIEERSRKGITKVIVNVGILTTGVDMPWIKCIVFARPTKSYNLYIQMAGRGTRPVWAPGFDTETREGRLAAVAASDKQDFIILDHAGNVNQHGFINEEPEPNLKGKFKESGFFGKAQKCKACFAYLDDGESFPCPKEIELVVDDKLESKICGWSPPPREVGPRSVLEVAGELKEITAPSQIDKFKCQRYLEEELQKCVDAGKSPWGAYYKAIKRFNEHTVKLIFFRMCKEHGIEVHKGSPKKTTEGDGNGFPFK